MAKKDTPLWANGPLELHRRHLSVLPERKPTRGELAKAAKDILTIRDSGSWGLGDLIVLAEEMGSRDPVETVIEDLVKDRQQAQKCYYVSKAIAPEDRRFDLWWSFYFYVYTLPPDARDRLLQLAEDNHWKLDEFRAHVRGLRRNVRADTQKFPDGTFGLIYIDWPWKYDNQSEAGSGFNGAAENHYPTMTVEEMRAFADPTGRTIADVAAKNCVMYAWATNPFVEDCIALAQAAGFEYKSNHVWVKELQGTGFWTRGRHELLLIFTKGSPIPPDESLRPDSVIEAPSREHSEKPEIVYDMLETLYPKIPKIEVFARRERPGWASFGNQLPTEEEKTALPDDAPADSDEEQRSRDRAAGKRAKKGDPMKPRLVSSKAKPAVSAAG